MPLIALGFHVHLQDVQQHGNVPVPEAILVHGQLVDGLHHSVENVLLTQPVRPQTSAEVDQITNGVATVLLAKAHNEAVVQIVVVEVARAVHSEQVQVRAILEF